MHVENNSKLLFIINPNSGTGNQKNWEIEIEQYFKNSGHIREYIVLGDSIDESAIKKRIIDLKPDTVVAVGGDGTIKLAADSLLHTNIRLGIIPAGSANGLAKELNIPAEIVKALDIIVGDNVKTIHVTRINDNNCIHLSDLGFNAFVIKKFETDAHRGMFGYIKAAFKVLLKQPRMDVVIQMRDESVRLQASMVVIANATKYGSGACINPEGKLDDELFEVVVVKKVSIREIFKMMVTHKPFDETKTQVFQVNHLEVFSKRRAHFQIDGEYLGKMNVVKATLIPRALHILIPATQESL